MNYRTETAFACRALKTLILAGIYTGSIVSQTFITLEKTYTLLMQIESSWQLMQMEKVIESIILAYVIMLFIIFYWKLFAMQ